MTLGQLGNEVNAPADVTAAQVADGVTEFILVEPSGGSPLSLRQVVLESDAQLDLPSSDRDILLFATAGAGTLTVAAETFPLALHTAAMIRPGEAGHLSAGTDEGLSVVAIEVQAGADVHAAMGEPARVVPLDLDSADAATADRSFQILFGPANGSLRATLFVGVVPPGAAPWHFHQYDEIVMQLSGEARYHQADGPREVRTGAAYRIRPRDVHINENPTEADMLVLGVFTPAGSPSAAYYANDPT